MTLHWVDPTTLSRCKAALCCLRVIGCHTYDFHEIFPMYLYCVNCQLPLFDAKVRALAISGLIQILYQLVEETCACIMAAKQIL